MERRGQGHLNLAEGSPFLEGGEVGDSGRHQRPRGRAAHGRAGNRVLGEYWCESADMVCRSVPVTTPDGRRVGVLNPSGRWDTASPVAELAVAALGRLVEEHLPADAGHQTAGSD